MAVDLHDQVVLVTGSSRGIGAAIARLFAHCGAKVAVHGRDMAALAGLVLLVAALLITLLVEVPIDNQIKAWSVVSLPPGWQQIRDCWEMFHVVRTFSSMAALVLMTGSALFDRVNRVGKIPRASRRGAAACGSRRGSFPQSPWRRQA